MIDTQTKEIIRSYKSNQASKYIPVRGDEILTRIFDCEKYHISTKHDGHLCFIIKNETDLMLSNFNGELFDRPDLILEITNLLETESGIFVGEIYNYKESERSRSFDLVKNISNPKSIIKIAVFDIISNGDNVFEFGDWEEKRKLISNEIFLEEERFFITIENGMSILDNAINDIKDKNVSILDGQIAFKLHDTYGFPLDLTADICRENKIKIDTKAFEVSMKSQKTMARESGKFNKIKTLPYEGKNTEFLGYNDIKSSSKILGLFKDGDKVEEIKKGDEAILILDKTPFYAESGGQVGDSGHIQTNSEKFYVRDTIKIKKNVFGHVGILESGTLKRNEQVEAFIDEPRRNDIKRNHSVTHLLHKALKIVLGNHVEQKGSLVDNLKTRFDFSHSKSISNEEIHQIESIVNNEILTNQMTHTQMMSIDKAKESGALMLFGEKYESEVRVLNIGNSIELCGGTHVKNTGDIGLFKIYSESGVASGVRRVEGVTGLNLIKFLNDQEEILTRISKDLNTKTSEIPLKVSSILTQLKENGKIQNQLKSELALNQTDEMLSKTSKINNFEYLSQVIDNQGPNELRDMIDKLKLKLKTAVIILAAVKDSNVTFAVGVTDNLTDKIDAGSIAKTLGEKVGGKGGGRKNMAMAGGTNTKLVQEAFKLVQTNLSS